MKLKKYARLAFTFMKFKLNREMMYGFNFWMAFLTDLSIFLLQILMFSALFLQVGTINGWNINHMIIFTGTFTIIDSAYMATYFFGVLTIPEKIRSGSLDLYLTKPVNTLFYVSLENIDPGSALLMVPGIGMVLYGAGRLGITLTAGRVAGYVFLLVLMYLLMYSLMIIIRTPAFRLVKIDSLCGLEGELVNFVFRIPGVVYRGVWKLIFFILLPYGLIATIPAQFLSGALEGRYWAMSISVCAVFVGLCILLWKKGLRTYGSASS